MKYFIILLIGEAIGWYACKHFEVPDVIEQRAKELNLMRYNGKSDKFIPKDTIEINGYELNYLIHGTTKMEK